MFMVFNTTFNNISVISRSVLLMEETGENRRPVSFLLIPLRGCRGRDHMMVGFTTTCAISAYRH
jgi:hypothetical protein